MRWWEFKNKVKWKVIDLGIYLIKLAEHSKNRNLSDKLYDLAQEYDPE